MPTSTLALEIALGLNDQAPGVSVETSALGEALFPDTLGRFDLGASQQLVLFVFLTALAGSSVLILTRQLGISKRMLSTPTSIRTIVVGEGGGRLGYGNGCRGCTSWPPRSSCSESIGATPSGCVCSYWLTFSAVGAAAGLLMGAVFSNDQQAAGIGIVLSLGLAALGGAMLPSELFSPTLQRISHLTPHAWALRWLRRVGEEKRHSGGYPLGTRRPVRLRGDPLPVGCVAAPRRYHPAMMVE